MRVFLPSGVVLLVAGSMHDSEHLGLQLMTRAVAAALEVPLYLISALYLYRHLALLN